MPPIEEFWEFHHTALFDADWDDLGLDDEALAELQEMIIENPDCGRVISSTGGLRKVRFALPGGGKSGGARVCYAFFPDHGKVLLVTAFGKSEKLNLSAAEKKELASLLKRYADGLDK